MVLGPATNAAAAAMHHTAGTYQLNQTGAVEGSSTIVLEHDHTVQPNDGSSSWSVQHRVVTIEVEGGQAGPIICGHNGQPLDCHTYATFVGPKTATGIASQSDEGQATGYVGTHPVLTWSFYAVRTGGVRSGVA